VPVAAIGALDVAFVAAIGTALAAIAGPFFAWRMGISNRRHERAIRAYDDMRDSYVSLLHYLLDVRTDGEALATALDRVDLETYVKLKGTKTAEPAELVDLVARAAPFTVGEISDELDDLAAEMNAFHDSQPPDPPQSPEECAAEAIRIRRSLAITGEIVGRVTFAMNKHLLGPN
jgi:hypothetical protein